MPLVFPRYCFWMVWGAPLGIPDYCCYRIGAPSLLADLEKGKLNRLLNLIMGGFLAGFVWEGLNFGAHCKWIYTVPGMYDWKIFEMPIIGFLGFPVLSIGAFSSYSLFSHFMRNKCSWENRENPVWPLISKKMIIIFPIVIILTHVVYLGLLDDRVKSRRPVISEVPDRIIKNADHFSALKKLANHKGMGYPNAVYLWDSGIHTIKELAELIPDELISKLKDSSGPSPEELHVWVRSAKLWGFSKR